MLQVLTWAVKCMVTAFIGLSLDQEAVKCKKIRKGEVTEEKGARLNSLLFGSFEF